MKTKIAISYQEGEAYVKRYLEPFDYEFDEEIKKLLKDKELTYDQKINKIKERVTELFHNVEDTEIHIKEVDWDKAVIDEGDVIKLVDEYEELQEPEKEANLKQADEYYVKEFKIKTMFFEDMTTPSEENREIIIWGNEGYKGYRSDVYIGSASQKDNGVICKDIILKIFLNTRLSDEKVEEIIGNIEADEMVKDIIEMTYNSKGSDTFRGKSSIGEKQAALEDPTVVEKLVEFFQKNPYPTDDKVHKFAEEIKIEPDVLEEYIYSMLSAFIAFGKGKGKTNEDFPEEQIKKGMEIETEHLDSSNTDPVVKKIVDIFSAKIARDHLPESDKYYIPYLEDMEKKFKSAFLHEDIELDIDGKCYFYEHQLEDNGEEYWKLYDCNMNLVEEGKGDILKNI